MRSDRADDTGLRLPLEAAAAPPHRTATARELVFAVLLILATLLAPVPFWARVPACVAIAIAMAARRRSEQRQAEAPKAWVSVDARGVSRTDETGTRTIVRWDEPFGLTVLANSARTRAMLAFTTRTETRCFGVRIPEGRLEGSAEILARAVTVAETDLQGDARLPLSLRHAAELVQAISNYSCAAFERIYLSDSQGGGVVLEAGALRIGEREFDLTSPLEWRGFMFHESGAHVATIYQGTWVRQGGVEVVLVAPMPAELSSSSAPPSAAEPNAQRRSVRELRVMQALPDAPPPRELRVAIERLFMLPLRHALDRAPRMSRAGAPSRGGPHAVQT